VALGINGAAIPNSLNLYCRNPKGDPLTVALLQRSYYPVIPSRSNDVSVFLTGFPLVTTPPLVIFREMGTTLDWSTGRMDADDLEPIQEKPAPKNFDEMSIEALQEYITELEGEILRAKEAIAMKENARDNADSFFKKG
jgi:uncharacterized small protein (DUF1192 family)